MNVTSAKIYENEITSFVFQLTSLEESEGSKEELDERMSSIDNQLIALRKTLNFLCKHTGTWNVLS